MTNEQWGNAGAPDEAGAVLSDRYRLEELVGRGGMASVFRASDLSLGRTVAIKIFRADLADADDLRRQREEITLLAGLNHPGLVTLFDAVADDRHAGLDRVFLVMEFIDGNDLRSRLKAGPLDPAAVALIGGDMAEALGYVHDRGVVHRDIKPGNILLPSYREHQTGARAKLADFGIARLVDGTRLTATGSVLGTASYLSPEQAAGSAIGPSSDVYSLGLVLIECLTGVRPFPGSVLESVAARLSRDPEIPGDFGPAWEGLLRSMTLRRPDERPAASVVAGILRTIAAASGASISAAADSERADDATRAYTAVNPAATTVTGSTVATEAPTVAMEAPTVAMETPTVAMSSAQGTRTAPTVAMSSAPAPAPAPATAPAPASASERAAAAGENHQRAAAAEAETVRMNSAAAAPSAARTPPFRRLPRPLLLALVAVAAVGIAVSVGIGVAGMADTAADATSEIQYPAVDGELGTHLEELQRSVAP